ncbi:MAG: TolC family protein [Chthoniobacterales bacterium]
MRTIVIAFLIGSVQALSGLTLDAVLSRTLEKNPAIQQAKLQVEQAAGRRLVLRAIGLPDARTLTPAGLQGGKRAGENSVQPFAFARGQLTQPLFHAGVPAAFRRGDLEVLIAQQRLNLAVMEQLHTARVAFLTALYQDSLRAFAEEQRQRLQHNVTAQSERYEQGQTQRGAVTVARVLEQEVQPRIEESRRVANGALLQLAQTMGTQIGPSGELPTADGTLRWVSTTVDPEAQSKAALARRADLQLARLLVRAAGEEQRMIEAAYFPAIQATVGGDYIPVSDLRRGSEGSPRRSDDIVSSELRLGATYSWRVIDNGAVRGAALRQQAIREINETVLARLEANVPRELTRIANTLRSLSAQEEALEHGATVAAETVTAVQQNLGQGLSSQLEYRTAESSLLQARAGSLKAAFDQQIALAELDRVTGRYFQFSDNTTRNVP